MEVISSLVGVGEVFVKEMRGQFLSENSRLWWAWIFLFFPILGAWVGVREISRRGEPVTVGGLVRFVFPREIYGSKSFRNDVWIFISLYALYSVVLFLFANLEAKKIVGKSVVFFGSGPLNAFEALKDSLPSNLGMTLLFTFLVIVVYDFGFTMLHYAFHKVPFLWRLHKIHHSAEVLSPLTVARFHLGEYALQKVVEGLTIGLVFGVFYYFSPENLDLYKVFGLSIFGIVFSSIGVFRHSHIWISYGWFDRILCSPAMHQIHHSKEPRHIDKNLSQIFSFWDWMLGTLYIPKGREEFAVGLSDEKEWNLKHGKRLLSFHLKPF